MINITRTDVFRLYPVFMIIAFWLVGGFFSLMASLLVIWNRAKVEAPMLGASISLIFALPVFRNTAPQSPPIGTITPRARLKLLVFITPIANHRTPVVVVQAARWMCAPSIGRCCSSSSASSV